MSRRVVVVVMLVWAAATLSPAGADAQDTPTPAVTAPDIIPQPNSGQAPAEAGDRGGALQMLILGVLVVAVGGAATHLVRQSRRARSESV